MPMNKKEMIACVTALAQAKSRQNIAEALEVYHPDVEMITPAFAAHARGREETGRQLGSFFKLFPDYAVAISSYTKAEDILLADGIVTVTPNTKSGTGRCPYLGRKIRKGGQIIAIQRGSLGEIGSRQLHAVAGISGKAHHHVHHVFFVQVMFA
ncbi:MAG: nuclear transport factor 2 family protein [Kordiimonadaceae bacterium]|nr:nuclear transport factor 2 family protein [Kordiimonadaceae bacterium]